MRRLGVKLSIIVTAIIWTISILTVIVVYVNVSSIITTMTQTSLRVGNNTFVYTINRLKEDAVRAAEQMRTSEEIQNAVLQGDRNTLRSELQEQGTGLDQITIIGADGNVILRAHNEDVGDSLLSDESVAYTLSTKASTSTIASAKGALATKGTAALLDKDGELLAVISCGHDLSLSKYVDEIKQQTECEQTIFAGDKRLSTTLADETGKRLTGTAADATTVQAVMQNQETHFGISDINAEEYSCMYTPLYEGDTIVGMLFSGVPTGDARAIQNDTIFVIILVAVICGLLSLVIFALVSKFWITNPLNKIIDLSKRLEAGQIRVPEGRSGIPVVKANNEIGDVAIALEHTRHALSSYVYEIRDHLKSVSEGDLTHLNEFPFEGDFVEIKNSMNTIVHNLRHTIDGIQAASFSVASGSSQITQGTSLCASSIVEQADQMQELTYIMNKAADDSETNAVLAEDASQLVARINQSAMQSTGQMKQMIDAVSTINQASEKISNVINAIDDIASQTNILALNASIEAARAGEAGKGFSVVAEEVRQLALKSSEAAKNSSELIDDSIKKAEAGMNIAKKTEISLAEIVSGVSESASVIEKIATSSKSQSEAVNEIEQKLELISSSLQQTTAATEESAASCEELSEQAEMLNQLVTQFKLKEKEDEYC